MNPTRGGWLIVLTLIIAMLLDVLRLPLGSSAWLHWLRPDWAVAAFFFWSLAAPERTGLSSAWFAGLFFDALHGGSSPFGLHGAGFVFTVSVANGLRDLLRTYGVWQQAVVLAAITAIVQLFNGSVRAVAVGVELSPAAALPALTTALVYPLVARALRAPAERFVVR